MFRKCILVLMLVILLPIMCADNQGVLAIEGLPKASIDASSSAKSSIVMDVDTGRVFYQKNSDQKLAIASTTKIVTAITAIENVGDIDAVIRVDDKSIGVYGTSIYLQKGEELSIRELLYGLMLRSGNDAATAIAYSVGGSIESFCEMMNQTARKAGATSSNFVNPHGLDQDEHYTTAYDLAKITAYALNNEIFADIVKTKNIKISGVDNDRYLVNKNKLLNTLDGCIGVKTGFTDNAGRCLVSACERDGMRVVCVVLNCGPMFEESAKLINAVYQKYKMCDVLESYNYVGSVDVENGDKARVNIYSRKGLRLPLSIEEYANIKIEYEVLENLKAPIKSEEKVGEIKIYYDKHLIFCEEIYTMEDIKSQLIKDKLKEILDNWGM
ncbi:MAG: D-alanyl-D-alanine carboxypeptidase [Clostridia bacterium]|nr:D-alanyl-D-alanine carboxypeptidase [Clostridia bacterium]